MAWGRVNVGMSRWSDRGSELSGWRHWSPASQLGEELRRCAEEVSDPDVPLPGVRSKVKERNARSATRLAFSNAARFNQTHLVP